jgi:hypothetical protein
MPDQQPLAGLGTEDALIMILQELRQINGRLPMKDVADAMRVSGTVISNPTSGTLTTLSTLTNLAQIGAAPANSFVADQMNQVAAAIIYPNIIVT